MAIDIQQALAKIRAGKVQEAEAMLRQVPPEEIQYTVNELVRITVEAFITDLDNASEPFHMYRMIMEAASSDETTVGRMIYRFIDSAYFTARLQAGHDAPYSEFRQAYVKYLRALMATAFRNVASK